MTYPDDGVCGTAIGPDGTIYAGGNRGNVYAIHPDGSSRWVFATDDWSAIPAVGSDGTVYAEADPSGDLYAISPDGSEKWRLSAVAGSNGGLRVAADGTIYVCSGFDDRLHALNPDGTEKWKSEPLGLPISLALGLDGSIYVSSYGRDLVYAYNPDGTVKWQAAGAGRLSIGPNGAVYVALYHGCLRCLDSAGKTQWTFDSGFYADQYGVAASLDGTVYVSTCCAGKLFALSSAGATKWQFDVGYCIDTAPLVDAEGTVYVMSADSRLRAINPDGSQKWLYEGKPYQYCPFAIAPDGTIYTSGGGICAIGSDPAVSPTSSIGPPSVAVTKAGPVSYTVGYAGSISIALSPADIQLNKTGTANGVVSVSGSGNTRTVTISNITGDGSMGISIAAGTASNNAGPAPAAGPSATFNVVNTPPIVTVSTPSVTSTRFGPVTYTVSYAHADSVTLNASDITLIKTGSANGRVTVTGSGNTARTATISSITGEGTLGLLIGPATSSNLAGSDHDNIASDTFAVVRARPTISIGPPYPSAIAGGSAMFAVSYRQAGVVTLSPRDITVNRTGTVRYRSVGIDGIGCADRTVLIYGITGSGTLGISIAAGTASNVIDLAPAAGPSAAVEVVNAPPKLTISAPSSPYSGGKSVSYTLTYSHAAQVSLSAADVHLNRTGTANGSLTIVGSGTAARTVTISSITGDGTLSISIDAGTASNIVGSAAAAGPSSAIQVASAGPTVQISPPSSASVVAGNSVSYTVNYTSASIVLLTPYHVRLNKTGTASGIISVSGKGTS